MLHKAATFTIPRDHTDRRGQRRDSEPSVKLSIYGEGEWDSDVEAAAKDMIMLAAWTYPNGCS
jgi:hypothetical protein